MAVHEPSTRSRVAEVEPLTDDAVAVTFEVPDDLAEEFAFDPGPVADPAPVGRRRRAAPPVLHLRPGRRPPARRRARDPRRAVLALAGARRAPRRRDRGAGARAGGSAPIPALLQGGRHLCIAAGSGITPMLSVAASVLAAGGHVTLLYGNRTSGSVMFAEELADLKNRFGAPAAAGPRALPRAPRRRAVLRPPRRRPAAPPAHRAGPGGDVRPRLAVRPARDDRRRPRRARRARTSRPTGSTSSCSTSTRRRPSSSGPRPRSSGETTEVTVVLDGLTTTAPDAARGRASSTARRRPAPTCRSPARAACAAPAGPRSPTARSTCAATTRSSPPRSRPASC